GIAAAFAESVEGALYLARTGIYGSKRVGDGVFGVVVGVDAEAAAGDAGGDDGGGYPADIIGKCSAVGVAENDPAGASLTGGVDALQRVIGICLETVKEMFGVKQRLALLRD